MDTEAQTAPEMETVSDDVHADVRAAMEALSKPSETEEVAQTERARNELGQFTRAESAETQQPAPQVTDADPAQGNLQQPSQAMEAPNSWSADAKAKWATLDPSIQAEIARREQNMSAGGQKWSEEKRSYEEILSPVRTMAQRYGVNERDGLQRLLAANEYLEQDPQAAIAWLAQSYGVDLSNLNQTLQDRPQVDPALLRISQEVNSLKATLQERESQEVNSELSRFATAPGHEHFEKVRVSMGHLLATGQAKDLNEAYERAVWADPEIRTSLMSAQTGNQQAQQRAREQAERAKRGALSVVGSPSAGAVPVQKQEYATVEEAARAAARQHGWAV
ncbi:hypothetical protein [Shinella sp.]|uniref:hypothetical protein n=1 Tax=Shinella sp. TaxID=1870904 RepID=UPI003D2CBC52